MAMFCLLLGSMESGWAESFPNPQQPLALHLKAYDTPGITKQALTREIASLMHDAGFAFSSFDPGRSTGISGTLVVAELRGSCSLHELDLSLPGSVARKALASVQNVEGRILPFIRVDCSAVNDFLGAALARVPAAQRESLYARALGRLVAHELYHFLAQTGNHTRRGLAQAGLNAEELLSIGITFDDEAAARMNRSHAPQLAAARDSQVIDLQ